MQPPGAIPDLVDHLFRHEAGKLAATLTRAFGLRELKVVDDIVQETLLSALEHWSLKQVPDDPTAWLHRVARNHALDHLRREARVRTRTSSVPIAELETALVEEIDHNFLPSEIRDAQLRMIFACSPPGLSPESQIALTLKTLCGFSVAEIANAFLTEPATIEKRLQRARKYFRDHDVSLEPPVGRMLQARLQPVLSSLYLLFNEGYKRSHSTGLVERDLCVEALRLALLVADQFGADHRECYALVSLMCFHAARFDERTNAAGGIVLLPAQDRDRWNAELLERARSYFILSNPSEYNSAYHLEAAIQYLHCSAPSSEETNWEGVLGLYRRLYVIKPTPIVALHMSVSLAEVFGAEEALAWIEPLPLDHYYLYHALKGDVLMKLGRWEEAIASLGSAAEKTRNQPEQNLLREKILECRLKKLMRS